MQRLIDTLSEHAARKDVALAVYDGNDCLIACNEAMQALYPFLDLSVPITYEDIVWACVRHRKLADDSLYADPEAWMRSLAVCRGLARFSKSFTRHSDGRIIQLTYERLEDTGGWWYQIRRDVTDDVLHDIRDGRDPIHRIAVSDDAMPRARPNTLVSLLSVLPKPCAIMSVTGHLIACNYRFHGLLSRGDGLAARDGRIHLPAAPDVQREFQRRAAGFFRRRVVAPVTLRVPRPERTTPYLVILSEAPVDLIGWESRVKGMLLVSVVDPDALDAVSPRIIADLLGITVEEARTVLALSAGRSVDDIARERGDDVRGLRAEVGEILNKTGFGDQACLLRKIHTLGHLFGPKNLWINNQQPSSWRH